MILTRKSEFVLGLSDSSIFFGQKNAEFLLEGSFFFMASHELVNFLVRLC